MPTGWNLSFLPKAQEDLLALEASQERRQHLVQDIADEFQGMKGDRITKTLVQGSSSKNVDRLKAAATPGSLRVHVQGDLRATVLCLPAFFQAYVTHVFSKAQDPNYKAAPGIHDGRVQEFIAAFSDFIDR